MNTPYREFLETTLERKYIARPKKEEKSVNYMEWFVDILIAGIFAGLLIGILAAIVILSV